MINLNWWHEKLFVPGSHVAGSSKTTKILSWNGIPTYHLLTSIKNIKTWQICKIIWNCGECDK